MKLAMFKSGRGSRALNAIPDYKAYPVKHNDAEYPYYTRWVDHYYRHLTDFDLDNLKEDESIEFWLNEDGWEFLCSGISSMRKYSKRDEEFLFNQRSERVRRIEAIRHKYVKSEVDCRVPHYPIVLENHYNQIDI